MEKKLVQSMIMEAAFGQHPQVQHPQVQPPQAQPSSQRKSTTFDFDRTRNESTHARLWNIAVIGLLANKLEPSHLVWGAGYWTKTRCWKVWYKSGKAIRMQEIECNDVSQTMGEVFRLDD